MNRVFQYTGSKRHLVKYMPARVEGDFYDLFCGSGVVSYNIEVTGRHRCFDTQAGLITIHRAVQTYGWDHAKRMQDYILSRWNPKDKGDFYGLREWVNRSLVDADHPKRGLGYLFLARSCFNGTVRFKASGHITTTSGLRFFPLVEDEYRRCHDAIRNTEFIIDDSRNATLPPGSFVYADPPYIGDRVDSLYGKRYDEAALVGTLKQCRGINNVFWYTDTSNRVNESFASRFAGDCEVISLRGINTISGRKRDPEKALKTEILITNWWLKMQDAYLNGGRG